MGILDQYRIVEFSRHPAGHILGMLLADQGANVFLVEPEEGSVLRGTEEFAVWNRGKSSVISDYSSHSIKDLVQGAQVVIESLDPGEGKSLGITYSSLSQISDATGVIVVSLPAFPKGHIHEDIPAREGLVASSAGVYSLNPSGEQALPGEGPSFHALYYASTFAAITAAPAVTAALLFKHRTGRGQQITVPVHDSMYQGMGTSLVRHSRRNNGNQAGHPVIKRFYKCGDGRWINTNIAIPRFLKSFLAAINRSDWLDPLTNFASKHCDGEKVEEWNRKFSDVWRERSAEEWESLMSEIGVPGTVCRSVKEWMDEPHAKESGAVIELKDPVFGTMKQPGILVRTLGTPSEVTNPAPLLGEQISHNE